MEIKYTTDGKKVVVLGKLNSTESIVQEIFISEKGEIPSGDNFVEKNLHDSPVASWKEKNIKEIERKYYEWESKLEGVRNHYNSEKNKLELFISSYRQTLTFLKQDKLDKALGVLSGEYKYLVVDRYGLEIQEVEEGIIKEEHCPRRTSLRLLGLFGDSEKGLKLRLTEYSDGSGSYYDCEVFATLEDAKKFVSDKINEEIEKYGKACDWHIRTKEKYSLTVPDDEKVKAYYDVQIGEKAKVIANRKKEIEKLENEIKQLEQLP